MRQRGVVAAGLLMGAAFLGGARAGAADAAAAEAKNEIVVFGGASILDVSRGHEGTVGMPEWAGDRWPGFPDIQVRTETSLGGSALFGARYSRYVKGRLAVEADLAVAPNHDLEAGGELCLDGRCFGRGTEDRAQGPWGRGPGMHDMRAGGPRMGDPRRGDPRMGDFDPEGLRTRSVTAWHYGGGLAYDVTGGDVRPVVTLGAGGVSWSGARQTSTDFVLRFGLGLKVLFGRVGGRVDVVDHLVTEHFLSGNAEHDIHATAGLLVRF
jgi:hypothetical protein